MESSLLLHMLFLTLEMPAMAVWPAFQLPRCVQTCFYWNTHSSSGTVASTPYLRHAQVHRRQPFQAYGGTDSEPCPSATCLCSHLWNELDFGVEHVSGSGPRTWVWKHLWDHLFKQVQAQFVRHAQARKVVFALPKWGGLWTGQVCSDLGPGP